MNIDGFEFPHLYQCIKIISKRNAMRQNLASRHNGTPSLQINDIMADMTADLSDCDSATTDNRLHSHNRIMVRAAARDALSED